MHMLVVFDSGRSVISLVYVEGCVVIISEVVSTVSGFPTSTVKPEEMVTSDVKPENSRNVHTAVIIGKHYL